MDKILENNAGVASKKATKPASNNNWKTFWSKSLAKLQGLGKSLMYPIALLPFAALLNRFGSLGIELNAEHNYNVGWWFGFIVQKPGATIFDQLPLIFAIGTAFGLAKDQRGEAGLVGAAFYLILVAFLIENGLPALFYKNVLKFNVYNPDTGTTSAGLSALFYVPKYGKIEGLGLKPIGGTYILNIGVLGGIVAGCLSAWSYNKFKSIKLPNALSFFGGRRFVPMIIMVASIPVAFLFAIIWPWFQYGLVSFGRQISSGDAWAIPGAFLYAFINRMIQPTGLHHIINTFLWFQMPIDGHIVDFSGKVVMYSDVLDASTNIPRQEVLQHLSDLFKVDINASNFTNYISLRTGALNEAIISNGNGTYTIFGDINAFQKSMVSGNFQTGYFPMFWGGLPGAALAMIYTAKKEHRKEVATFLGGVAFVAALTGIDEPLVFAFIFVGPILWVTNALFTAIFAAIAIAMQMHVGFGFSGGFIDYVISAATSWGMSKYVGLARGLVYGVLSNPLWMFVLAGLAFPTYFFSFKFLIKKLNIKTPGREDDDLDGQLKTGVGKVASANKGKSATEKYQNLATQIVAVVGIDNIVKVDNCATRLRLTVKDNQTNIDDKALMDLGIYGIKRLGQEGLQIIVGTDVEHVADIVHEITNK